MKYTVEVILDDVTEIIVPDLTKSQAMKMAVEMVYDHRKDENCQIFVSWFRLDDGQHGYLNPGGDHAIIGQTW